MRRASVVARWRCVEVKGRKPWLGRSEPPLRVCLGPLALSQGSTVSSHRHKALQGPPPASPWGTQAPQPQGSVQWLPHPLVDQGRALQPLWSPRTLLLLRCHCRGRQVCLSVCLRAASCVSLPAPPPLKNHTTLPPAPGPPVSFDRTCLPQQGLLRSLKRRAAAE